MSKDLVPSNGGLSLLRRSVSRPQHGAGSACAASIAVGGSPPNASIERRRETAVALCVQHIFGLKPPPQSPRRQCTRAGARDDSDRAKPASKRNRDHDVAPSAHGADSDTLPAAGRTGGRVSSPFVVCFLSSKPLPYGCQPYPRTASGCKTENPFRPQRQRLAPTVGSPKNKGQPGSRLPLAASGTRPEIYGAM